MSFDALGDYLEDYVLSKLSLLDLYTVACVNTSLRDGSNLRRYLWHVFDPPEERPLYDEWELHGVDAHATRCIDGVQADRGPVRLEATS